MNNKKYEYKRRSYEDHTQQIKNNMTKAIKDFKIIFNKLRTKNTQTFLI